MYGNWGGGGNSMFSEYALWMAFKESGKPEEYLAYLDRGNPLDKNSDAPRKGRAEDEHRGFDNT